MMENNPILQLEEATEALINRAVAFHINDRTYAVREEDGRWTVREWLADPWGPVQGRYDTLDELMAKVKEAQ
jgi:hypothetical protein